jgi:hypothetical protein
MPELRLHNQPVESVFNLLGEKENAITFSLGWAFSKSPDFLKSFLKKTLPPHVRFDINDLEVVLQERKDKTGITDIEIREINGKNIHLIIEAKRGWTLPNQQQLEKYVPRIKLDNKEAGMIVTMSESSESYARACHLPSEVKGIPVKHISWEDVGLLCQGSKGSHAEKRLMRELRNYLATIVNMQKQDSNWVYVVSLGNQECAPGLTFKQVVNERRRYFHPYGRGGWPKESPNYIGFRYDGILQSIHHIESTELFKNFHAHFPEYADEEENEPFVLYKLGKAIHPEHEVKAGKVVRSLHVWAMLDLLLTCPTISEARDKSNQRSERI